MPETDPNKTKGQGFAEIISQKVASGEVEIILQVEVSSEGNTTITVFKELKKHLLKP